MRKVVNLFKLGSKSYTGSLTATQIIITLGFASFYALMLLVQSKIHFSGKISQKLENNTVADFSPKDYLVYMCYIILFSFILLLLYTLTSQYIKRKESKEQIPQVKNNNWKTFLIVFTISFIISVVYLLSSYPGSVIPDSFSSVGQALGDIPISNHHPLLFSGILSIFIHIGLIVWNSLGKGVFLFCVFQSFVYSLTMGFFVMWIERKTGKICGALVAIYFIFNTIFRVYSIAVQKDALFAISLTFLMLFLVDFSEKKEMKHKGLFYLLLFLTAFLRNNGLLVIWLICIVLVCFYGKEITSREKAAMLALLLVFSAIQGPGYRALGVSTEKVEAMSIPIQQMAYVLTADEAIISDSDKQFLSQMLSIEEWQASYHPFIVDSIKWNPSFDQAYFDQNITTFLRIWLHYLPKSFPDYIKAYAMETYGFWSIGTHNYYGFADNYVAENNNYNLTQRNIIKEKIGADIRGERILFPDAGTLFWICLLGLYLSLMQYASRDSVLPYLPALLSWTTIMIATPVAFSLRYAFVLAMGLPFFILSPIICAKEKAES